MARFNIKKITAVAAAAAVMSSMTACGENTTWGATIDGSDIPAGIFIYYLQSAYYSAQSKLNEENSASSDAVASADGTTTTAAVFSSQIDGKDATTWIYDEATKSMQEYAAIEAKFTELGLTITADEKDAAKVYCDQTWDYAGEYYTKMGISEKSFTSLYLNSQKRDKVFKTIYSEGGEYAVSDDEKKTDNMIKTISAVIINILLPSSIGEPSTLSFVFWLPVRQRYQYCMQGILHTL